MKDSAYNILTRLHILYIALKYLNILDSNLVQKKSIERLLFMCKVNQCS